jgi:hypothetical protein
MKVMHRVLIGVGLFIIVICTMMTRAQIITSAAEWNMTWREGISFGRMHTASAFNYVSLLGCSVLIVGVVLAARRSKQKP